MKIAIDIRNIGKGRTGDEAVFFALVKNLALIDANNTYHLLIDTRPRTEIDTIATQLDIAQKNNFKIVPLGSGNKFIWNAKTVARYCTRENIDIYHTQYIIPFFLPRRTKIVTHIHDVSFKVYTDMVAKRDLFFLNKLIPRAVRQSDKIIAVSRFTKKEIIKYYAVADEKITVIHNATDLKPLLYDEKKLRKKYHLPQKYVLTMGTMQPRKNIPFLIEAFARIAADVPDVSLVLAGKKGYNFDDKIAALQKKHPSLRTRIIFTGYIDEVDKYAIYNMAKAFVFPSLYEGFGLPILEAFVAGVPVAASDIAPHREVGGDAVLYFDPQKIDQCTKVLYDVLVDDKIRKRVLARAVHQREKFSWHISAKKLCALYEELSS